MTAADIKYDDGLLIISVKGDLSTVETIEIIKKYYPIGSVKDVIWDYSDGSLQSIAQNGFKAIADAVKEVIASGARQGGRTAFVGNATIKFGMLRMYTTIAETSEVPIEYYIHKTIEEAVHWLKQD